MNDADRSHQYVRTVNVRTVLVLISRICIYCWTYSPHCQIPDKNPSKRWNGEFRGFRICIGFAQRDFVLWGFLCSINFSLYFPATTPRATSPHRCAQGYHALTTTARLSRPCIYPGYHAIVYFYSLVVTPELSRSTTHVNRVITPAIVRSS